MTYWERGKRVHFDDIVSILPEGKATKAGRDIDWGAVSGLCLEMYLRGRISGRIVREKHADVETARPAGFVWLFFPIECKNTKRQWGNGQHGRYEFREDQHKQLLAIDGWYCLGVWDWSDWDTVQVRDFTILRAAEVDRISDLSWGDDGRCLRTWTKYDLEPGKDQTAPYWGADEWRIDPMDLTDITDQRHWYESYQ